MNHGIIQLLESLFRVFLRSSKGATLSVTSELAVISLPVGASLVVFSPSNADDSEGKLDGEFRTGSTIFKESHTA